MNTRFFRISCMSPGHSSSHRINSIKSLRMITFMGLKEAKETIDACIDGKRIVISEDTTSDRTGGGYAFYVLEDEIARLRSYGFSMTEVFDYDGETRIPAAAIKEKVINLIKEMINAGEFDLAVDLMTVAKNRFK